MQAREQTRPNCIRAIREARGLLVVELAAKLPVDQSTLWRWERGHNIPDHRKEQLAAALECTVGELMGWEPFNENGAAA